MSDNEQGKQPVRTMDTNVSQVLKLVEAQLKASKEQEKRMAGQSVTYEQSNMSFPFPSM